MRAVLGKKNSTPARINTPLHNLKGIQNLPPEDYLSHKSLKLKGTNMPLSSVGGSMSHFLEIFQCCLSESKHKFVTVQIYCVLQQISEFFKGLQKLISINKNQNIHLQPCSSAQNEKCSIISPPAKCHFLLPQIR